MKAMMKKGLAQSSFANFPTFLPLALLLAVCPCITHVQGKSTYRAGVYAHAAVILEDAVPVSRAQALKAMQINLDAYLNATAEAKRQDVDILVLPEDGLYGYRLLKRDTMYPYLEYIPDPTTEAWNPCDEPDRYNNTELQVALSCMAKQSNLYLVANIGDKQACDLSSDPSCPSDKRYQYNTDVAYSPDGTFLAKYHKVNLFYETQFDTPDPTYVYFDTPFGRFGMLTCFDLLFKEPAIPLVENYNVTNIAFPTAWMDALPIFPAIGYHSSFARMHGVNFLGANLHLPQIRFDGSGLYSPSGSHGFYYGQGPMGMSPKLVVGDIDILTERKLPSGRLSTEMDKIGSEYANSPNDEFSSKLFEDVYAFRTLDVPSGQLKVCRGQFCCELDYEIQADQFSPDEIYAFGTFDGLHTYEGRYYLQNCALVKCLDSQDRTTCGSPATNASTTFTKIFMRGSFQTKYVYPQVINSDSHGQLGIFEPGAWTFDGSSVKTTEGFNGTLLNVIMIGRDYSKDSEDPVNSECRPVISLVLLFLSSATVWILAYIHAE